MHDDSLPSYDWFLDDARRDDSVDFARLKGWTRAALEKHGAWYREARECYDFVAGRQWSAADREAMQASQRQPIEFNRVGPIVDAICGMEVNNRQAVRFRPRTMGDVGVNERLTDLADWARDEAQAEDEESAAFRDAVICGRGVTETRLDFEEEPTGKIVIDRRDPLESFVDPAAAKANFADARYMGTFRDIDISEAEAMFPGTWWSDIHAGWAKAGDLHDGGNGDKTDYPAETRPALMGDERRPRTVRVVQIQWWERTREWMLALPGAEVLRMNDSEWQMVAADLARQQSSLRAQPVWARRYRQAFLGAHHILTPAGSGDEASTPAIEAIDGFSLCWMTGRSDATRRVHYGVVRPMIDPQMLANKMLSQVLHILNTNAKGGLMAEKTAFSNPRAAERDWADPSKIVLFNDGALAGGRVRERAAPPMPPALPALQEFSISSIRDVVGVNVEMMGAADRAQAASLEYQRRQSAMSILAPLFDGLRRYRKTQGQALIATLKQLPPGVLVRVVGDANTPKEAKGFAPFDPVAFGLGEDAARFDVIVDEAPASPNNKELTWSAIQPFMGEIAKIPKALEIALKYSPLPQAAAQELSAALTPPAIPPQLQAMIEQGQTRIAQLAQENEALKADRSIAMERLRTDRFEAETERMEAVNAAQTRLILAHLGQLKSQLAGGAAARPEEMMPLDPAAL